MHAPAKLMPILKKRGSKESQRTAGSSGSKTSFVLPPDLPVGASESGFRTKPEADPIVVQDHNVAKFSLPAEALSYQPLPDQVITKFKNGDQERKIHCNIELGHDELHRLSLLQSEAVEQGVGFFPSVASMATRFLSRSRGDVKRALKLMQVTQEWRENYFKAGPITDESVMDDMRHGIVYFSGRDRFLRPTVIVRGSRIPQQWYKEKRVDKLIRVLVFCTEYFLRYMVVPGKVENLNVIVDLKGLSISQVPLHALHEVYNVMSHHYIGRVFRFYVANMPFALRAVSSVASAIMTDRQRQKLTILESVSKLKQEFAPHQLEQDLGGSLPAFAESSAAEYFPFPLRAGPFDPGCSGPDSAAVPNVHKALTAASARGSLWDPRRSPEENTAVRYSVEAHRVLVQCGLPVPFERKSNSRDKIMGREVTPRRKGEPAVDESTDTDGWDPQTMPSSQASTEAGIGEVCDCALSPSEDSDEARLSPAQLRERARRSLRQAVRSKDLREALAQARDAHHPVIEEAVDVPQMCQGGMFGLAACWLQPARR